MSFPPPLLLHYVYILRCANDALYTGYTVDVANRLAAHSAGKGARYTRAHRPVVLLRTWGFSTKRKALQVEYKLKQLPRSTKSEIVSGSFLPAWLEGGVPTAAG